MNFGLLMSVGLALVIIVIIPASAFALVREVRTKTCNTSMMFGLLFTIGFLSFSLYIILLGHLPIVRALLGKG